MVLEGKRFRFGSVLAGLLTVISSSIRPWSVAFVRVTVQCTRFNSEMGTGWVIGQCAMSVPVMQDGPCRIMAYSPGGTLLIAVARGAGTSGRRP